jgi:hypothetical protein
VELGNREVLAMLGEKSSTTNWGTLYPLPLDEVLWSVVAGWDEELVTALIHSAINSILASAS